MDSQSTYARAAERQPLRPSGRLFAAMPLPPTGDDFFALSAAERRALKAEEHVEVREADSSRKGAGAGIHSCDAYTTTCYQS